MSRAFKRSSQVAVPLVAAAAVVLMSGCRKPEMQRCVDENNHVVDESLCANQPQQQRRSDGHGGFFFLPIPYRSYYGGMGGFDRGSSVSGGSYMPLPGRSYSTTRGGFGRFFSEGGGGHAGAGEAGHGGGVGE